MLFRFTKMSTNTAVIGRSIPLMDCAAIMVAIGDEFMTTKIITGSQATSERMIRKPGAFKSFDMLKVSVVTYAADSAAIGMEETAAANKPMLKKTYANGPRIGSSAVDMSAAFSIFSVPSRNLGFSTAAAVTPTAMVTRPPMHIGMMVSVSYTHLTLPTIYSV